MPIRNFPFLSITPDNVPRPWLPIKVVNPHKGKDIFTYGLIDTGADECSMPSFFASQLGHDLNKGTPKGINTAGGLTTAYSHTTEIDIFGKDLKTVAYHIPNTLIDFTDGLQVVLLGVKNFLDQFILEIAYPKQNFSIKRK
ncbi:MAG: hypothetical protein C4526_03000 [Nitrospiraceae bacterium]|nr:MAG: hypothetical protein C4526_03000 [Nitrospiraceae bacterium]